MGSLLAFIVQHFLTQIIKPGFQVLIFVTVGGINN